VIPPAKTLTTAQVAEGRAACAAYLGLADALKTIYPWVMRVVDELDQHDELPEKLTEWPEKNHSVRGAAYHASGGLNNDWCGEYGPLGATADEMAVLLRRLNEAQPSV
jgi:hypothetical protein